MSEEANITMRHMENVTPALRTVLGPQRHVTQSECERVVHVQRNGRLMTWGVIDGGKREVWR